LLLYGYTLVSYARWSPSGLPEVPGENLPLGSLSCSVPDLISIMWVNPVVASL
jgi:hypothetical protein